METKKRQMNYQNCEAYRWPLKLTTRNWKLVVDFRPSAQVWKNHCVHESTITTTTQTTTATIGWKILSAQARTTVSAQALKMCEVQCQDSLVCTVPRASNCTEFLSTFLVDFSSAGLQRGPLRLTQAVLNSDLAGREWRVPSA